MEEFSWMVRVLMKKFGRRAQSLSLNVSRARPDLLFELSKESHKLHKEKEKREYQISRNEASPLCRYVSCKTEIGRSAQ
jgi:hypothetical protein